jgi:hypothetical protein
MLLLTYDHGGLVLWGLDSFRERLKSATEWLDRYPSFKIGLDNEAFTYDALAEQHPEALKELRGILSRYKGRFGVGTCTYGQPLSVFINEESNIRQIGYALEADRRVLGAAPDVYLMSEHAMHSQIPQIIKGFGFRGAIMRTHFMMYGYNPTFDLPIGWWVGLDGTRMPTVPTYREEGNSFGRTTVDNWILTRYPGPECNQPLEDFRKTFSHIGPLLASRADDAGLRREDLVRTYEGNPDYRWILLEELLAALPQPAEEMRTGPNDYVVRMPWGYCGNEIWNTSRQAEVKVLSAERLAALESLLGGADHAADLRQAWRNLLVAQHHDIQICGLLDEAHKYLPASIAASDKVTEASLRALAARMRTRGLAQVTVFNPLSWQRKEWVETTVSLPQGAARAILLKRGGKAVPTALLTEERHPDGTLKSARVRFATDLKGLQVAAYSVVPTERASADAAPAMTVDPAGLQLATPHYQVRLSRQGGLEALVDARSGRSLLQAGHRSFAFAGRIDGEERQSTGKWTLEAGPDGAPWAIAREKGDIGGIPYALELTFRADSPRIDCRAQFSFNSQRIGRLSKDERDGVSPFIHEDKLRFQVYPALAQDATGVRDLPFAIAETPDAYVQGLYWTALADKARGLAYLNRGTMGAVREKDGAFSLPLAYSMYYVWGTRILKGDYSYEWSVLPFEGSWKKADVHRRALEYNLPPLALATAPGKGDLGATLQPIRAGGKGTVLSALYPENGRVLARFYEYQGGKGTASLAVEGSGEAHVVDLAGAPLSPFTGALALTPWQIRTVSLKPNY